MKSGGTRKDRGIATVVVVLVVICDGYHNSRSSNDDVGFKNTSEFLNMNERNELNKS